VRPSTKRETFFMVELRAGRAVPLYSSILKYASVTGNGLPKKASIP